MTVNVIHAFYFFSENEALTIKTASNIWVPSTSSAIAHNIADGSEHFGNVSVKPTTLTPIPEWITQLDDIGTAEHTGLSGDL